MILFHGNRPFRFSSRSYSSAWAFAAAAGFAALGGDFKSASLILRSLTRAGLQRGGAHALFIENFGDVPFTKGQVSPETIAAMAAAGCAIRAAVKLPIGFNVLRNDPRAALALCAACGGGFVRVNVHRARCSPTRESSRATLMRHCAIAGKSVRARGFLRMFM